MSAGIPVCRRARRRRFMPGHTMPNLIGSSMHQSSGMPVEPVPALARMQHPAIRIGGEQLGGRLVERNSLAVFGSGTSSAFHGAKNQSFFARNSSRDARDRQPARDGLVDRLLRQRLAGRSVHHRGRDLVRRDQRIERRRARLRAVRLVEPAVIDRAAAVADVDVRRLRQRGEQLVRRVRGEHRGAVFRVSRRGCRASRIGRGTSD